MDVQKVFAKGRAFFNPLFTLKFLKNPSDSRRFTVVVSTKVSKSAVRRNRIKRVLREYIRLNLPQLSPGDYAVVVKPAAAGKEAEEWRLSLEGLFKRSRLMI